MANIQNYFQRAVALLASQFQIENADGSLTNLQKMIQALSMQAQVLNTQEQALQTMRYLETAIGVQLDGLGQILGLARIPGQTDDSYREDLQFQIFVNESNGTPEEMIYILKYLTNATEIWYNELYPAAYQMATNGLLFPMPPSGSPSDLLSAIQEVSPAGVSFAALTATYNVKPLVFSSDPITEQFYVSPDPNDPSSLNPFEVNPGAGAVDLYIQRGEVVNPDLGGCLAEALGEYPTYTIDTTNSGQLAEAIGVGA